MNIKLQIYNLRGRVTRVLYNGFIDSGEHRLIWDGKDNKGRSVSSGVYFYRLKTDNYDKTKQMIMIK